MRLGQACVCIRALRRAGPRGRGPARRDQQASPAAPTGPTVASTAAPAGGDDVGWLPASTEPRRVASHGKGAKGPTAVAALSALAVVTALIVCALVWIAHTPSPAPVSTAPSAAPFLAGRAVGRERTRGSCGRAGAAADRPHRCRVRGGDRATGRASCSDLRRQGR